MKLKQLLALSACLVFSISAFTLAKEEKPTTNVQAQKYPLAEHRGFSIPQIDLNDRTDLHTVVSEHPKTYMGHPSSVLLDDGKTMVIMYLDRHGRGNLMWRRSEDGGHTWTEDLPLPDGWGDPLVIDSKEHPQFLEIPILYKVDGLDGKQRICMYTSGRSSHPARYAVSEDGGQTWSKIQPILFDGKELLGTVVLFSDMVKLNDGRYMATYHNRGTLFTATTGDGIHFNTPVAAVKYPKGFPCEGCFIRSPDGGTIALLMRENTRTYNSLLATSNDEGKTWSDVRQLPDSLTGDRHQHTYTPDGRLFISFRDTGAETPTRGDWIGWIGTFDDIVAGREGEYRVRLKDNFKGGDCAYPTQHRLPNGTIFAATYGQWTRGEPNAILAYHFKIEQLDEAHRAHVNTTEKE